MASPAQHKVRDAQSGQGRKAFEVYRQLCYGEQPLGYIIKAELYALLLSNIPGALGLLLRKWCYPSLFQACGKGVIFGRQLTLRHAHKITLGDGVILDDGVVLDAKGHDNRGIRIGDRVYIGRHTIIYCKNGNIDIEAHVNISSNVQVFSSHQVTLGAGTVIAAFTYILSGGQYDYTSPTPFAEQSGMITRGPTEVGPNCWLGAHAVVVDGVSVGEHCVIGAGAVVTRSIPPHHLATGIPAKAQPLPAAEPG